MSFAMLTAVLLAFDPPGAPLRRDAVTRSLASLVEACVRGLVADAVLAGPPQRNLSEVADDAGCGLVESANADAALGQALGLARCDHILLLRAGCAPERGFIDEAQDAFAYGPPAHALVLRSASHSLLTHLAPRLAAPVGVIAARRDIAAAQTADFIRLARRLRGADLSTRARRV